MENSLDNANDSKEISTNFIKNMISEDLEANRLNRPVATRFPPEPNGYLHIGHAKSICLNFGIAKDFSGTCNLRFDDTNPVKEDTEYVESIQKDIKWLGFDWEDRLYYASDYFPKLYDFAVQLIKKGKAYVDSLTAEEIREYRGTLTKPGKESPYRNRSVEENLTLFTKMKNGEFKDGEHVLRAKIDMASPNINMRDPAIYRIRHFHHHRTGDQWSIYPMYDYAHCVSDALEKITHSICSLEFEDHRPLYDWFLNELDLKDASNYPQQIEFARLNLTYTVMSKRKLLELVKGGYVSGWDDPRMPTLSGFRRRGYTPEAIRNFCEIIGVAKRNSTVEIALLEFCLREDLNKRADRAMVVLNPLKVVITNYPEGQTEELLAENNPENPESGTRIIPFSREIYIEREDFMENPPKKFHRLYPGNEIRLKHAYYIKCVEVIKNDAGEVTEVHCTYDPDSRGGWTNDGRKVKGTSHWVSIPHALKTEVRLYNHLFLSPDPENNENGNDYKENINPNSLEVLTECYAEPSLAAARAEQNFQFLRQGYFCVDAKDSSPEHLVFNRTVSLKDSWSKNKE